MKRTTSHISRFTPGLVATALLVLIACSSPARDAVPTFAPPLTTAPRAGATHTVSTGDIAETVEARGRVAAKQESLLVFPLAGKLKAVHVAPGDAVEAGLPLAELDAPDLARQALDRQYVLTDAELRLAQAELTARSQAALTAVQLAQAELSLAQAEAELSLAQAQAELRLAQAEAELGLAQAQAQHTQAVTITQELALARLRATRASSQLASAGSGLDPASADVAVERSKAAYQNALERLGMIHDDLGRKTLEGEVLDLQFEVSLAELSRDRLAAEAYRRGALAAAELALAEVQYAQEIIAAREAEAARAAEAIQAVQAAQSAAQTAQTAVQMAQLAVQMAQTELQTIRIASHLLTATQQLQVDTARTDVELAGTLYLQVSQQLSSTLLLAPFSGQVVAVEKRPGDQVEAYESIGVIADPSELWVVATVLAEDIDRVAVGQPVTARLDAFPDQTYTGSVLQIASQTSVWQGRNAYDVTVAFDAGQQVPAIIRMGADVVIVGPSHENVLVVPSRAIITIGGQTYVEVLGQDGQVERVAVQTGVSDGAQTEIVAGLQKGQTIRIP